MMTGPSPISDRLGDVLRLGGFLVNPLEIETHLCAHATVADAQVVAVATERGNRPVAFVIATPGSMVDPAELVAYCKHALAGYKVPHRVIAIDAFPTTPSPNGPKIQKGVLRQMAQASLATGSSGTGCCGLKLSLAMLQCHGDWGSWNNAGGLGVGRPILSPQGGAIA